MTDNGPTLLTLLSLVRRLDRYKSITFRPHNDWLGESRSFIHQVSIV